MGKDDTIKPYWDDENRDPVTGRFPPAWDVNDPATLTALADEIVTQGRQIEHMEVPDLKALIDAVQAHEQVLLSRVRWDDRKKGKRTKLGVFNKANEQVEQPATIIQVHGGEVLDCDYRGAALSDLDIGCTLDARTRFVGDARFIGANFGGDARFIGANFGGDVRFIRASFGGGASFSRASFTGEARFDRASFAGAAWFVAASFAGDAQFVRASFAGDARFDWAFFARAAQFGWVSFAGAAWFESANFGRNASYENASFERDASFVGYIVGDYMNQTVIEHDLCFTGATINRRLLLGGEREVDAVLREDARLGFDKLVVRAGASVELSIDQLARVGSLIKGEDSDNLKQLEIARADYNRLRDFFKNQPSTDEHEEICNYRYLQLSRRVRWLRAKERSRKGLRGIAAYCWEWWVNAFDRWVKEFMLGYLIRSHRILITGGCVIALWAMIFRIGHAAGGINYFDADKNDLWAQHSWINSFYFSVVTFTSLGYGDIQPKTTWMKGAAASEALIGLALMALFIVAWARKMVR